MIKMKKIIFSFALSLMVGVCSITPIISFAATTEATARKDVIKWRYKTENKKMYRRKYNYSKQVWVGEWEFIANVVS